MQLRQSSQSLFRPVPTDETVDHQLAGLARTIRVSSELDPDRLLSYRPVAVADRAKGAGARPHSFRRA